MFSKHACHCESVSKVYFKILIRFKRRDLINLSALTLSLSFFYWQKAIILDLFRNY